MWVTFGWSLYSGHLWMRVKKWTLLLKEPDFIMKKIDNFHLSLLVRRHKKQVFQYYLLDLLKIIDCTLLLFNCYFTWQKYKNWNWKYKNYIIEKTLKVKNSYFFESSKERWKLFILICAFFSSSISKWIQEDSKPLKRLRLVKKPVGHAVELNLQSATSSQECLQILLKLEESFPIDGENISTVLRELLDHFSREKEAMVRCKIANIIKELSRIPGFNHDLYTSDIIALLKTESNCLYFLYFLLLYLSIIGIRIT